MAPPHGNAVSGWYDLFSRGARDWLRHNEKVAESVRRTLPEIVAGADVLSGGARTVRVPVRFLEHYHFQLRAPERREGVGEGEVRPGDRIGPPDGGRRPGKGEGGRDQGGFEFMLEFQVDDIVDWLWEEMKLPNLQARVGKAEETDWMRGGLGTGAVRGRGSTVGALSASRSSAAAASPMVRRSPTRTCASASSRAASSRPPRRWCSSSWTSPAA